MSADVTSLPCLRWLSRRGSGGSQASRSSARPALAPLTNAAISLGSRISAGPPGSVDWRSATRPPGSFLASRQSPPLEPLQGLAQPSAAEVGCGHAVTDVHGQISLRMVVRMRVVASAGAAWAQIRSRALPYSPASSGLSM